MACWHINTTTCPECNPNWPRPRSTEQVKGWECPKCGRCYSPSQDTCIFCNSPV